MVGRKLFAGMVAIAAAQPSLAADPVSALAGPTIQTSALSSATRAGHSDREIHAAVLASSMAGMMEGSAAASKRKRLLPEDSSAEASLLAGAGLLSPVPYLPACIEREAVPSFPCQMLKRQHEGR